MGATTTLLCERAVRPLLGWGCAAIGCPGSTGVIAAIAAPCRNPEASISAVWIDGLAPDAVAPDVVAATGEIAATLWH